MSHLRRVLTEGIASSSSAAIIPTQNFCLLSRMVPRREPQPKTPVVGSFQCEDLKEKQARRRVSLLFMLHIMSECVTLSSCGYFVCDEWDPNSNIVTTCHAVPVGNVESTAGREDDRSWDRLNGRPWRTHHEGGWPDISSSSKTPRQRPYASGLFWVYHRPWVVSSDRWKHLSSEVSFDGDNHNSSL